MKVKCYIPTVRTVEVEIDDKFKALAVERPWEHPELTNEMYEEAVVAVEKATGLKMDDTLDSDYVCGVEDIETEITILEM